MASSNFSFPIDHAHAVTQSHSQHIQCSALTKDIGRFSLLTAQRNDTRPIARAKGCRICAVNSSPAPHTSTPQWNYLGRSICSIHRTEHARPRNNEIAVKHPQHSLLIAKWRATTIFWIPNSRPKRVINGKLTCSPSKTNSPHISNEIDDTNLISCGLQML